MYFVPQPLYLKQSWTLALKTIHLELEVITWHQRGLCLVFNHSNAIPVAQVFFVRQLSLTHLVVRSIFHLVGGSGALAFTHLVSSGCGGDFPFTWLKVQLQRIWSSWLCVLFSTGYLTIQDSCQLLSSIFLLSTQIENKFHDFFYQIH